MATWSISPDTSYVSIDNTGKLTYQRHTADTQYTVSYVGDNGCTASKVITIKKCGGGEYHFDKQLSFQLIMTGGARNPIFNSLEIFMDVYDDDGNYLIKDENIGTVLCQCGSVSCPDDKKTNNYAVKLDETIQLDPAKPLSAYTVSLRRSTAIAREWEDGGNCNYPYKSWNEPSGTFEKIGEAYYKTTLDKLSQNRYIFMIYFEGTR
jgi:hypothetical protein